MVIRPKRSLLATAVVSVMLATAPLFAVLYWMSGPVGDVWVPVLVTHLALFFTGVGVFLRQLMVFTAVTDEDLIGNGIFSRTLRVPLASIAEVVVVETHVGMQAEKVTQYLVRDADERCVFRLRGNFWNRDDVEMLLECLPAEPTRVMRTMKLREFLHTFPGSAYWFENRPWLQPVAALAVVVIVGFTLVWAMAIAGLSIFA